MDISIIITTYNREKALTRLIDSILKSNLENISYELVVVDDHSDTDVGRLLKGRYKQLTNLRIIEKEENTKKSASVNMGMKACQGDYILLIDDDTVVDKETIKALLDFIKDHKNTIAGPLIVDYSCNSKVWFAGLKLNYWTTTGVFRNAGTNIEEVSEIIPTDGIVTAFIFHKDVPKKIGYFNEELFPFQFEELDYCTRAKYYGYELSVVKESVLFHDHKKAGFIKSPWRLYYEVRNRLIIAKLWSQNNLQSLTAGFFAHMIPALYIPISLLICPKSFPEILNSIYKGIFDSHKLTKSLIPYKKRKKSEYKNWK